MLFYGIVLLQRAPLTLYHTIPTFQKFLKTLKEKAFEKFDGKEQIAGKHHF